VLLWLSVPKLALLVAGLALFTREGIVAAATCQTVLALGFAAIGIALVWRRLGATPAMLWADARPIVFATLLMSGAVLALDQLIASPWLSLVLCLPTGAAVYGLALVRLAPHAVRDALRKLAPGRFATEVPTGA
jgi:hypothetical protein